MSEHGRTDMTPAEPLEIMSQPLVLNTVADLRRRLALWRGSRETVALVPTMGALHAGHASLARAARARADRCIVSIFVNPTQFAANEDFGSYPRSFAADLERLGIEGVDAVFAPDATQMYPDGFATTISLKGPAEAGLEDRFRPTHFAGVATVVAKLLIQSMPDLAVFGEKDFQQLAVIRRLVRDIDLPVEIQGAPTLREADGLAMSSRNVYLSAEERRTAPLLHRVLSDIATQIASGASADEVLARGREEIELGGFALDYLDLRDAESLGATQAGRAARLLVAARIGRTRLIDNIAVSFG
jgi:pantoate--beta-alanine ligase